MTLKSGDRLHLWDVAACVVRKPVDALHRQIAATRSTVRKFDVIRGPGQDTRVHAVSVVLDCGRMGNSKVQLEGDDLGIRD